MNINKLKLNTDQRPFIMIYHDFLESELLSNPYQITLYICLKKFADKNNQCFPSLRKLTKISKMSQRKVQETLKELEEKRIISIENRVGTDGGKSSNLYTIHDFKELWNAGNNEEVTATIEEYEDNKLISILESKGYTVSKGKGLASEPTKEHTQAPKQKQFSNGDHNITGEKSQAEKYSLEFIRKYFECDLMIQNNPSQESLINAVINVLHNALNTTKPILRVNGENKPREVVIGRLLKLKYYDILYAINQFEEQTKRIKIPTAYLLTIIYNSKEQSELDVTNRVAADTYDNSKKRQGNEPYTEEFEQVLAEEKTPTVEDGGKGGLYPKTGFSPTSGGIEPKSDSHLPDDLLKLLRSKIE